MLFVLETTPLPKNCAPLTEDLLKNSAEFIIQQVKRAILNDVTHISTPIQRLPFAAHLESCRHKSAFCPPLQTLVNRGFGSRFILEGIIKALITKSSRSLIMTTLNRVRSILYSQPDSSLSDYLNFHTCLHKYLLV